MGPSLTVRGIDAINVRLRRALPGRCAFCLGKPGPGEPWCEPCLQELPWNVLACPRCAEPMQDMDDFEPRLCGSCLRQPPSFLRACVPLRYQDDIAALVQRFKFSASPRAGTLLLGLLEAGLFAQRQRLPSGAPGAAPQALISVPLHTRRARQRGFDQADWLAVRLGKRLGIPCIGARRLRMTPTQRGLKRQERQANLHDAFHVACPLPARVALIDDVMTTGATFESLARTCLSAGAEQVEVWAAARTPRT